MADKSQSAKNPPGQYVVVGGTYGSLKLLHSSGKAAQEKRASLAEDAAKRDGFDTATMELLQSSGDAAQEKRTSLVKRGEAAK